ncbi:MAG: IPT/TIG domain-containing protein, partial [Actinobacteria bacterium]|nr:IPT/TIG domain-containing protein [Actinomycetota bacterium]
DQYKVDVVFNGHNHYYERSYPMRGGVPITGSLDYYWQPDGVVYVTAGCAGAPLVNTGSAPWVAKNAKEYNYCVVDVLPNRSMRVQAKKRDGSLLEQFTIAKDNAPILYSVSPSTARAGEEVTVSGKRFGLERGSSAVWFGSTRATEYASWSDEQVKVRVPGGVSGQVQLKVQTQDGSSKTVPFTVLLTPSDQAPTITSISPSSGSVGTTVTIKGTSFGSSRGTSYVKFNTTKAATTDYVSWSASQIKVKVPQGATTGPVSVTTGVGTSKSKTFTVITPVWYLAEGTSDYGFETYITIENPNATAVTAMVTYMTKAGPRTRAALALPAMSQTVINPRNDIDATDFSTKVECKEDKAICVDRRMIWTGPGAVSPEGHSSVGVTAPAKTWYLAEGSSSWGFETWLLIQNPNDKDASVTITYMIEGETPVEKTKTVTASSRASFNMETDIGQKDTSIKVESNIPVIPERAMYRNNRREGHDSIGTTTPAKDYYLAEGTTAWGFTTYVLVQNPNPTPTDVTVTYMTPAGEKPQAPFSMPANSRKTIRVNDIAEVSNTDLSTKVQGTSPIIAERAMYWDNGTGEACHDSIGMDSPHMTFYLPDGETYNGMETWTLIQNPNASAVTVEISYLTPTGTGNVVFTETIGANSRESYSMADKLPNARASVMVKSKDAGKPIMVERAMYWNNKGAGADTIGGYGD